MKPPFVFPIQSPPLETPPSFFGLFLTVFGVLFPLKALKTQALCKKKKEKRQTPFVLERGAFPQSFPPVRGLDVFETEGDGEHGGGFPFSPGNRGI